MQLIYIHGLEADHTSVKGQWLADWCALHRPQIQVRRPNLNLPPEQVLAVLQQLIAADPDSHVVGSSLGGFYATQCVARFGVRAVLVNPSVRPFVSMQRFFQQGQASHATSTGWVITPAQLDTLGQMFQPVPAHPERMLVLLQTGDEVLDYRQARDYYSQDGAQCPMLIERGGDHFMHDLQDKIPLVVDFLFGRSGPARAGAQGRFG